MHRLLMLSSVYQMSGDHDATASTVANGTAGPACRSMRVYSRNGAGSSIVLSSSYIDGF